LDAVDRERERVYNACPFLCTEALLQPTLAAKVRYFKSGRESGEKRKASDSSRS
jgi:hypothetical protein